MFFLIQSYIYYNLKNDYYIFIPNPKRLIVSIYVKLYLHHTGHVYEEVGLYFNPIQHPFV